MENRAVRNRSRCPAAYALSKSCVGEKHTIGDLGGKGEAEPTMRITIKIASTAEGHTVEITVEPPSSR